MILNVRFLVRNFLISSLNSFFIYLNDFNMFQPHLKKCKNNFVMFNFAQLKMLTILRRRKKTGFLHSIQAHNFISYRTDCVIWSAHSAPKYLKSWHITKNLIMCRKNLFRISYFWWMYDTWCEFFPSLKSIFMVLYRFFFYEFCILPKWKTTETFYYKNSIVIPPYFHSLNFFPFWCCC